MWDQDQAVLFFFPTATNDIWFMSLLSSYFIVNGIQFMYQTLDALPWFSRTNPGLEDWNGKERGSAVLNENVHGIKTLFHLQDEVCIYPVFLLQSLLEL